MAENEWGFVRCPCCGSRVDKDSPGMKRFISDFCELRTPLNSVVGFSRVLLREENGPLNDKQKEDLSAVHNSGMHVLDLINDIIDTARIWSGSIELELQELDLRKVIDGVLELAKRQLEHKPVQLTQDLAKTPKVYGDPWRVRQILMRLIFNAIRFTDEGSITIRTQTVDKTNQQMVQITIQDTGIGIPAEHLDAILKPFEFMETSTIGVFGIGGLGLAISKALTELQGGQLWVKSEVGSGSAFHFTLPVFQS